MIQVEHVTKSFGRLPVLQDVGFRVEPGQIYGLIGYNGVGKTTLMKIVSGIYRPDQGLVRIYGEPAYENPAVKRRCFFMTEEVTFFPQASLQDMRGFYRGYYRRWSDRTFQALQEVFGIPNDVKISSFSKGMQRQAGLILAFSTGADALFLDEAFDGLDYSMRCLMKDMLRYYAEKRRAAILISSHNLQELEDLADRIGMLSNGRLVFDDTTVHMREQYQQCRFSAVSENKISENETLLSLSQEGNDFRCVVRGTKDEAYALLKELQAEDIRVRPIHLEEFFEIEREMKRVDWEKVFASLGDVA